MAGLACAQQLAQAGVQAVVFDKGRSPGGRVATRRVDGRQFDHGAQYVTATSPAFASVLAEGVAAGVLAPWDDGSAHHHLVGTPGMSALAKMLTTGLDIRHNQTVTSVVPDASGWRLQVDDHHYLAQRVVLAMPAPQVAGLLGPTHPLVGQLEPVRFAPCLTLMATVQGAVPFVSRRDNDDPLAWIAQDSHKPGRPPVDGSNWVAQAGIDFSQEYVDSDPDHIAALMLPLLCDRLGVGPSAVTFALAHRWRYARVLSPLGQPFLRSADASLYLSGDWCLGARVEAAWSSGTAVAQDLVEQQQ
jgi:predicted NAD/FAD-dependent oxidoreductase